MFRFSMSRLGWRGYVGLAIAIAIGLGLIVLSFGIALILLPIVAVALLVGRWRLGKAQTAAQAPPQAAQGRIIEVEYSVIEDREKR